MKEHNNECETCDTFIAVGEAKLKEKLSQMESTLPDCNINEEDLQDLSTLVKYMLFSMPKISLPIGAKFTKAMRKAMDEAGGSVDQIKIVAFPTNEQRKILNEDKLVLNGPWGSGKTLFLIDKAHKLSKEGKKVLFGIMRLSNFFKSKAEPLILFDLEQEFKDDPNVEVKLLPIKRFWQTNNLAWLTKGYSCLIVDEAPDRWNYWTYYFIGYFDYLAKKECRSVMESMDVCWVAPSNENVEGKFRRSYRIIF